MVQAVRKLHQAGFAHLALNPRAVLMTRPIRIVEFDRVAPIGSELVSQFSIPGFSAPELVSGGPISGKEDVYSMAAILYRAVVGEPIPEEGANLSGLSGLVRIGGVPQVLALGLAPVESRADLETFFQHLLSLKRDLEFPRAEYLVAGFSNVGLNVTRTVNEDSYGYATQALCADRSGGFVGVFALADGMGGMESGEVASRAAIQSVLSDAAHIMDGGADIDAVRQADLTVGLVREANTAVCEEGKGGGTTLTCAVINNRTVTLAWVGDSRAYLLRDGALKMLTDDHSLVNSMVKSGMITSEEARQHPESNKLTRSLGSLRQLPDWYVDDLAKVIGERQLELKPDDTLLLCSDGLWGQVTDEEMAEVIRNHSALDEAGKELVRRCLRRGAPDNVTLLLVRLLSVVSDDVCVCDLEQQEPS